MDSSVQIPNETDPREIAIKFIRAMETNADSKEALKKAYQVLSKDENASLPANVLPQVLPSLGMNLTDVEVNVIIHRVKPNINNDGEINCVEFLEIMKNIWTKKANELIKAMEKDADSNEALRKSYQVLSKDPNATVSAVLLRQVMPNLGVKLSDGEVDEIINEVKTDTKNDGEINCEEFVNIMKNIWTKIASKLIKAMEDGADSHEAHKKAYLVLSMDENTSLSSAVLRQVVPNLSNLTDVEVDAIIRQVKPSIDIIGQINCEDFFKIMKNVWTKKAKELMKAMEKDADSNEALKNSYQVLSKDPNASLSSTVLLQVMTNLGVNLTDVEVSETINHIRPHIKNDGQINREEFFSIMKNIWTKKANELIKAMENEADSKKALRKSYQVLSKDPNATVSVVVLRQVMPNLGVKLTDGEVDEIINQVKTNVKNDEQINCDEFVNIMKNTWTKIANKLIKAMEEDAVSHEALKKAYLVLSRDENVSLSVAVLRQVMPNLDVKRTDVEVDVIINLVKPNISSDGQINYEEFVNIMKKTELANKLIKTMEEDADSHKVLQNAYLVLTGDENASLSVDVLHQVLAILGINLIRMEIDAVIQQVKPNINDDGDINRVEFVEIMKNIWTNIANKLIQAMEEEDADSHKALKKAYLVLSRDKNTSFPAAVLCQVMPIFGMKLTDVEVNEIINSVKANIKNDRHINREKFVNIMKNIWTMIANQLIKAIEEDADSNKALEKSYQVLRKDPNASLSVVVLQQVMANLGVNLTDEDVNEIINRVKPNIKNDRQINREEFVNIMKYIWMKIANELIQVMEEDDSHEALQNAYLVFSRDENASFSVAVLCQVMPNLGLKLTDEDVNEIINQVKTNIKNDRQINCEEFVNIMKKIWTKLANELIKTMEEGGNSDMVLKKAYSVLTRDENASLSAAVLRQVMPNLGVKLTDNEVHVIISQCNPNNQINFDIFVKIMEKIWTKACNELTKSKDPNAYVPEVLLRKVMANLGVMKLSDVEVDEIINQVNPKIENGRINYAEIIKIINFIKEPTVDNQLDKIYGVLKNHQTKKIVLYGKPGVGKTWMARKIADRAIKEQFYEAIWIYLNSGLNLDQSIAFQLFPQSDSGKVEANEDVKLLEMIGKRVKGKKLLLILDGEKDIVKEDDEMSKVETQLPIDGLEYKLLFLIPKIDCEPSSMAIGIMVMPLTQADSTSLLEKMVKKDILSKIKEFAEFFIDKSQRTRAEVLIISRIVNYFGQTDSGLKKLQSVKDELLKEDGTTLQDSDYSNVIRLLISRNELLPTSVLIDCYSCETPEKHFLHRPGMVHFSELISYWILEGHLGQFDSIEDAYKKGHHVLMELLHYGILKHVENNYVISKRTKFNVDIHDFCNFFQNIHLGLATAFDNKLGSVVPADGMMKTFSSNQERKGISTLLLDGNRIGESPVNLFKAMRELGNSALPDELTQFTSGQERKELLTLTSDQSRIGEVDELIKSLKELEILAIFNPTLNPFPLPLYEMPKLRLLVLRGCKFLKSLDDILNFRHPKNLKKSQQKRLKKSLSAPPQIFNSDTCPSANLEIQVPLNQISTHTEQLTVLEISGPSSLKEIPDDLFKRMSNLKSLNLSFLQIVKLPETLYSLSKVEFLILRGCSCLEKLGTLENFTNLQVLDLSGATSFTTFQDKSFSRNKKLQILNLSQTKITKLPLVCHLQELKYLSLSACTYLCRVRKIGKLEKLQILDISGAERVDKFLDPSLKGLKSLVLLNVSGTAIRRLPSMIFSPLYLYLRDCSRLEQLPPIITLDKVQVLDLSGSVHLKDIKEKFIENLKCLRELNLSKTKVVSIPSLSSLRKLQRLLLSQCLSLKSLEGLSSLKELEFLDLSGCKALLALEDKSFDEMNCLWSLNLSEIQLNELPSLLNLKNLKELYLRNCPNLNHLLDLQTLEVIDVLDHSRTPLKPLFPHNARPRLVIGPSSSSSDDFDPQKCLNDLGCITEEPPSDVSKLPLFQQHKQTNIETLVGGDEKEKLPQKEMYQSYWSISSLLPSTYVNQKTIGGPVKGVHFLQLLKMTPSLLENIPQFHFFVYPEEAHTQFADKTFNISELELREIYFQQVSQHPLEAQKRCLEIHGFLDFPQCLGQLLKHAKFVVLIENSFIRLLSDLGADNIKGMKVCWIERCNNMDHVIFAEEAKETERLEESVKGQDEQEENFAANLEILWVSDVTKLSCISNRNSQRISFKTLKSLYLEFCPELSVICPSSQQLSRLEILHVKYCQKLETLFGDEPAELPHLHSLHLWGLPELKKISCTVPSLRILRVGDCHLLENIFDASTCPGSLETLQVKFCDQLKTIIKDCTLKLGTLKSLNLLNLPVLTSIGSELPLLKEQDSTILGCPKLSKPDFKQGK